MAGKAAAETALTATGIQFDFDASFERPNLDMLRPNGDGKYPAVATEKDRSLPDESANITGEDPEPRNGSDDMDGTEDELAIQLDDLLPDVDANSDDDETDEKHWLKGPDGYKEHKASSVHRRLHIRRNDVKNGKKSTDRQHRVRAYT